MAFLFNKKKSPTELVKSTHKYLVEYQDADGDEKTIKKYQAKLSDTFSQMRVMLFGDTENEPKRENIDRLCDSLLESDLFYQLIEKFSIFDFEARKDVSQVLLFIIRNRREEIISTITRYPQIIDKLLDGYQTSDLAITSGSILREFIRYPELSHFLLTMAIIDRLFVYIQVSVFDIASDAFNTLKSLLTKQRKQVAIFLEANFDVFFTQYNTLLTSDNYVTKRFALKLLADVLLARDNFNCMMLYINKSENLRVIMSLLKGNTKTIQVEAFHVFKIFVANPRKTDSIKLLLYKNKQKLIDFISQFQKDQGDEQLNDEKNILLNTLAALDPPEGYEPPAK